MRFEEHEFEDLKQWLADKFSTQYAINDKAHQLDHVIGVADLALEINAKLDLGIDRRMVVIPAICHDVFTWSRCNHHVLAFHYLMTVNEGWMLDYKPDQRQAMARACLEHRASYLGDYTGTLSELIASADRGRPHDVHETIIRSFNYAVSKLKMDVRTAQRHAIEHVKEKFGKMGYAKYPDLYLRVFGNELEQFKHDIDALDMSYFSK